MVRQSAEDKAYGRLRELAKVKQAHPDKVIGLMGCLVGVRDPLRLREKLPQVDVFLPPSDPTPMVEFLRDRALEASRRSDEAPARAHRDELQDTHAEGTLILPMQERNRLISAHVPVVYGCSHACTFCIIPYRRGVEKSRPVGGSWRMSAAWRGRASRK